MHGQWEGGNRLASVRGGECARSVTGGENGEKNVGEEEGEEEYLVVFPGGSVGDPIPLGPVQVRRGDREPALPPHADSLLRILGLRPLPCPLGIRVQGCTFRHLFSLT